MTRQASLFDAPAPAPRQPAPAASTTRPASWRAPTAGEHPCSACKGAACYADGPTWFCFAHPPAGFLPHTRAQARDRKSPDSDRRIGP